jgi:fibronectin-binding autotransporter adhesin
MTTRLTRFCPGVVFSFFHAIPAARVAAATALLAASPKMNTIHFRSQNAQCDRKSCASHRFRPLLLAVALAGLYASSVEAASYTWRVTSGDWSVAANWGGTLPTINDNAYISNGGTAMVTTLTASCNRLTVDSALPSVVQMTSGALTVSSSTTGDGVYTGEEFIGYSANGNFIQSGGTHTVNFPRTEPEWGVVLGYNAGSSGSYSLSGGLLQILGGDYGAPLYIGNSGSGSFTQSGGVVKLSDYNGGMLYLGENAGSSGSYVLSGSGQLNCLGGEHSGNEYIGGLGAGVFTQTGGTNNDTGYIYLGNGGGTASHGTYNLNGGLLIAAVIEGGPGGATFNFNGGTLQLNIGLQPFGPATDLMPMTLGSSGGGTFDSGGTTAVIAAALSGPGSLTKVGSGTLVLGVANTYSGSTLISQGTLQLGNSLALQDSTLNISGAGVLSFGTLTSANVGGLAGSGALALGNSTAAAVALTVGNNGFSTTYTGALSGSGSLTKIGSGELTLAGSNIYTGGTTIGAGTLQVGGGSGGSVFASTTVSNGGELLFNPGISSTYAGAISGTGSVVKIGSGSLALAASSNYSGGTILAAGSLVVSNTSGSALGSGSLSLQAGTLASGPSGSISGGVVAGNNPNTVSPGGSGTIGALGVGSLTLNDLSTLVFDLASTSSHDQINVAGSLRFSGSGAASLFVSAGSLHNGAYKLAGYGSLSGLSTGNLALGAIGGGSVPGSYSLQLTGGSLDLLVNYTNPSYTLSASAANSTLIVGGSTSLTVGLANNGGTANADSISFTGLTASGSGYVAGIASSGTVAPSYSASNSAISFSSTTAGTYVITPTAAVSGFYGATPSLTASQSASVTILGHSLPAWKVASGNNQMVIIGASGVTAGITLSDGTANQTGLAALDVNALGGGVSGPMGGKIVASGSSQFYTATLSTGTFGTQIGTFSLNTGDDHTLPGAAAAANVSANVSFTVLDHSNASLSSSATQTTVAIDFGNFLKGAAPPASQSYTIYNLAANTSAFYTSSLKLTGFTSSGDAALSTTLLPFAGLAAGGFVTYTTALNTANYTTTGINTITMSAAQLADANSFPGAGGNNNGAMTVTLVGNVGNAIADASGSPTTFGPALTAQVASSGSYANLSSTVNSTTGSGGGGAHGTTATILAGTNATANAQTVSMQWRTRASSDPGMASDILDLGGMSLSGSGQADVFALEMSYDAGQFGDANEQMLAAKDGQISLDWLDPATGLWENAIDGDFGTNVGTFHLGAWPQGDLTLGDWGVDTTDHTVWAVIDHNSTFAVLPEPSTFVLLAACMLGLTGWVWRERVARPAKSAESRQPKFTPSPMPPS